MRYLNFSNLRISQRTYIGIGALGLLLALSSVVVYNSATRVIEANIDIERASELLDRTQELRLSIQQLIMPANDVLILGADQNEEENFEALLLRTTTRYDSFVSFLEEEPEIGRHALHIDLGGISIQEDVAQSIFDITDGSRQIFDLERLHSEAIHSHDDAGMLMEQIDREADDIVKALSDIVTHIKSDQDAFVALSKNIREEAADALTLMLLLTLLLLLVALFTMIHYTVKPLERLSTVANQITSGDTELRADVRSRDEIGMLAGAFNTMVDSIAKKNKEVLALKDEFVFIAAHELRTPATAIRANVELILDGSEELGPETLESIKDIEKVNLSLVALVNDLLEVARSESNKIQVELSPQDMGGIVVESIDELSALAKKSNIIMEYTIDGSFPKVLGDPHKIKEVVTNLIGNAIKYGKEGGTINIYHEIMEENLVTHVKDSGIGMTKEEQEKLFQKFYRAENDEVQKKVGTGLGLFITKELVERMGGRIWVESEKGKGSTFSIRLALAVDVLSG